jgi:C-terminal processing protease CtpA/Prc
MSVVVGVMRYRFPDGSAFEGVGIAPDVVVERRIVGSSSRDRCRAP